MAKTRAKGRPVAPLMPSAKERIQALDREQPLLPVMPGVPERRTHTYVRHGRPLPSQALS